MSRWGLARGLGTLWGVFAASAVSAADLYDTSLTQIGVTPSLHAGMTPQASVRIAVLDELVRLSHQEFAGKDSVTLTSTTGTYTKTGNHGTHVAGIAAASLNNVGMVGVYPYAGIISIGMFDDNGWVGISDYSALSAARSYGAIVANMSYGPTKRGMLAYSSQISDWSAFPDIVIAKAAGNDGTTLSSAYYARDASTTLSHLLIVGSVDSLNRRSSFSNAPGENCFYSKTSRNRPVCTDSAKFKQFFLVAPGQSIYSSVATSDTAYARYSGTSMATPYVTGTAALLKANWPTLTASDIASIIKQSAQDLGTKGVDGTYGWGLLRVDKAMQPVGTVGLAATTSSTSSSSTGSTTQGTTSSRRWSVFPVGNQTSAGRLNVKGGAEKLAGLTAFDSFGRDFNGTHLAQAVDKNSRGFSYLGEFFGQLTGGRAITMVANSRQDEITALVNGPKVQGPASQGFWFGSVRSFGSQSVLDDGTGEFAFAENIKKHVVSAVLGDGVYQGFFLRPSDDTLVAVRTAHLTEDRDSQRQGIAVDVELQYRHSHQLASSFDLNMTVETGGFLGSSGSGLFDLAEQATTVGFEHHLTYAVNKRWVVDVANMVTVSRGRTEHNFGPVADISDVWAFGSSLSAVGKDLMFDGDIVTFSVGLPLQAVRGGVFINGGVFDRDTGGFTLDRRRLSIAEGQAWTVSAMQSVPLFGQRMWLSYGGYSQFDGGAVSEFGAAISLAVRL